jgi:hypothetical protein
VRVKHVAQSYRTGELALADVAPPVHAPSGGILVDTTGVAHLGVHRARDRRPRAQEPVERSGPMASHGIVTGGAGYIGSHETLGWQARCSELATILKHAWAWYTRLRGAK